MEKINVLLIISSLEYGGAERQVVELMNNFDRTTISPTLCSLSDVVPLAENLLNKNEDLVIIAKKWKYDFTTVFRVAKLMKDRKIDVVHAFLFDSEVVARFAAHLANVSVSISSERNSDYSIPVIRRLFYSLTKNWTDGLIANSKAGKNFVINAFKLNHETIHVIYNGLDIKRFYPDKKLGCKIRKELGITELDTVIGMVASFKKQKHHDIYLKMAKIILGKKPTTWFLMVGEPLSDNQQGADEYHKEIRMLVDELQIKERCFFLGSRNDMLEIYNSCDITVLTSSREGTPNVLLESMACGVPVVASDVADNSIIVKNSVTGFIVPFGDIDAFVEKTMEIVNDSAGTLKMASEARDWVANNFSTEDLAKKTESIYRHILYKKKHYSIKTKNQ